MKKLLLILLLALSSTSVFAQSYLRATKFIVGLRSEYSDKINWEDGIDTDILIKVDDAKVTIYSKATQVYRKVSSATKIDRMSTWRTIDANGKYCNLSILTIDGSGAIFIYIEYSDMAWMYKAYFE